MIQLQSNLRQLSWLRASKSLHNRMQHVQWASPDATLGAAQTGLTCAPFSYCSVTKMDSTVRYLGVELADALGIIEAIEIYRLPPR